MTDLGALRLLDPEKWARTVRRAMREADGRVPDAAEALGISTRQLYRWLADPLLDDVKRAPVGKHRKD